MDTRAFVDFFKNVLGQKLTVVENDLLNGGPVDHNTTQRTIGVRSMLKAVIDGIDSQVDAFYGNNTTAVNNNLDTTSN